MAVHRAHPVSLWYQVKADVRDRVVPGLAPGDQIPGENELCDRYGVSRTVVRQAIGSLVNDGVLFRRQGQGTFVAPRKLERSLMGYRGFSFTRDAFSTAGVLEARLLGADEVPPTDRVKQYLQVTDRDTVYRIRRLLLAGEEPIAYQVDVLPRHLCTGLISDSSRLASVGRALSEVYGLVPSHMWLSIECVTADAERVEWLRVSPDTPLMMVVRVFYLPSGEPIRLSRTRYRHDRFKLVLPALPIAQPSPRELLDSGTR